MRKKIIYEIKGIYRDHFRVTGYEFGKGKKSVCIVGSSRGNEVQQLYCCTQLVKKIKQLEEEKRIAEGHKILVIPSINPYSMNIQKRFWSTDNTDINRMFPGYDLGETTQRIADGVFKVISEYRYGIQFTSFYMPGEFVPHVRMMDEGYSTVDAAKMFGLPYVVIRKVRPYDTATLNYNWQVWDTEAFSLYTTTTARIDQNGAGQAVLAVLNFLSAQGIVKYNGPQIAESKVVNDTEMVSVRTAKSGIFEASVKAGAHVKVGQPLANIIHPYDGEVMETLFAPINSQVFFIHDEPLIYANTAVIKLVGEA
ncbi:MAG: M14 family metallopeptidase [Bacteroidales bacterium]|nr:M14 family metallopeptidase [Lachnoclostridium sp.]MCM1383892.1 M14 family metallopeptidase [Lachnoclostridium sp.]MCM1464455.1 M14 family metallopeptidase [Bacteroidales bacterium]